MATDLDEFVSLNVIPLSINDSFVNSNTEPLPNTDQLAILNTVPLPNMDQFTNLNIELLNSGPHWAGVSDGDKIWMPGLIWDGTQFVRYRMWDGNNWQISVGHDTT